MILCDKFLRYRGLIDAEVCEELLKLEMPGLKLISSFASTRRVTGWQEIWGTPRTAEIALESGSAFLFGCENPPDDPGLPAALFKLEEEGAGKRRAEGFGRISISDQFHQQVQQEEALL